jgi:hypothetical protein
MTFAASDLRALPTADPCMQIPDPDCISFPVLLVGNPVRHGADVSGTPDPSAAGKAPILYYGLCFGGYKCRGYVSAEGCTGEQLKITVLSQGSDPGPVFFVPDPWFTTRQKVRS